VARHFGYGLAIGGKQARIVRIKIDGLTQHCAAFSFDPICLSASP